MQHLAYARTLAGSASAPTEAVRRFRTEMPVNITFLHCWGRMHGAITLLVIHTI